MTDINQAELAICKKLRALLEANPKYNEPSYETETIPLINALFMESQKYFLGQTFKVICSEYIIEEIISHYVTTNIEQSDEKSKIFQTLSWMIPHGGKIDMDAHPSIMYWIMKYDTQLYFTIAMLIPMTYIWFLEESCCREAVVFLEGRLNMMKHGIPKSVLTTHLIGNCIGGLSKQKFIYLTKLDIKEYDVPLLIALFNARDEPCADKDYQFLPFITSLRDSLIGAILKKQPHDLLGILARLHTDNKTGQMIECL
ncbi:MAG: hypothetical protein ACMG6E_07740, partial [Candidatus Roizmanbacteria bacterium]